MGLHTMEDAEKHFFLFFNLLNQRKTCVYSFEASTVNMYFLHFYTDTSKLYSLVLNRAYVFIII